MRVARADTKNTASGGDRGCGLPSFHLVLSSRALGDRDSRHVAVRDSECGWLVRGEGSFHFRISISMLYAFPDHLAELVTLATFSELLVWTVTGVTRFNVERDRANPTPRAPRRASRGHASAAPCAARRRRRLRGEMPPAATVSWGVIGGGGCVPRCKAA